MWSVVKWLTGWQEKSRSTEVEPTSEDRLIRVLGVVDLVLAGWDLLQALSVLAG